MPEGLVNSHSCFHGMFYEAGHEQNSTAAPALDGSMSIRPKMFFLDSNIDYCQKDWLSDECIHDKVTDFALVWQY